MTHKIFSKIITPRLIIRPVVMEDADGYFAAEQSSANELAPHWSWVQTDKSVEDIKKFIQFAQTCHHHENTIEMYFSLLSKETNQYFGMVWFYEINWFVPHFEIHYWLDTRESGKGYMIEAVNALTRACFDIYKAKRVQIKISSENIKSQKIPEQLGFKLEARMENYFFNFVTKKVHVGLQYSCCNPDVLPKLAIEIHK